MNSLSRIKYRLKIPHRHFVFSMPKILRRYFLYDRKLLADLSRYAWESLKVFMQEAVLFFVEYRDGTVIDVVRQVKPADRG